MAPSVEPLVHGPEYSDSVVAAACLVVVAAEVEAANSIMRAAAVVAASVAWVTGQAPPEQPAGLVVPVAVATGVAVVVPRWAHTAAPVVEAEAGAVEDSVPREARLAIRL